MPEDNYIPINKGRGELTPSDGFSNDGSLGFDAIEGEIMGDIGDGDTRDSDTADGDGDTGNGNVGDGDTGDGDTGDREGDSGDGDGADDRGKGNLNEGTTDDSLDPGANTCTDTVNATTGLLGVLALFGLRLRRRS